MDNFLLIPASLSVGKPKTDRSTSFTFHTLEISPEEYMKWHAHNLEFGWLGFSANVLTKADMPTEQAKGEFKSASQRLRAVLFLEWKRLPNRSDEDIFPDYYEQEMSKIIEERKSNLE